MKEAHVKTEKATDNEGVTRYSLRVVLEVKPGNQSSEQRTSTYNRSLVFLPDNLKIGEKYEFSIKVVSIDRNGRDLYVADHFGSKTERCSSTCRCRFGKINSNGLGDRSRSKCGSVASRSPITAQGRFWRQGPFGESCWIAHISPYGMIIS